mmetsp:Transcript_10580/g.20045  ORF Transcript_10580/g.20045 Transcript_10580/m.20045 type:complete len:381 (+) Transcript_10580:37-1179(+)
MSTAEEVQGQDQPPQPEVKSQDDQESTQLADQTEQQEQKAPVIDAMEIRVLIDNSQVGGIIGKKGTNVKTIRETTGVYLSILKSEFRNVQERVMVLKGQVDAISKAIRSVTDLISESVEKRDGTAPESIALRLLVHRSSIGAIIGKGGQTIKELQTSTSTRIQISTEPLPNSLEKSVTVIGTAASIESAMASILKNLKDNPLKPGTKVFPYIPGVMIGPGGMYGGQPNFALSPPGQIYGGVMGGPGGYPPQQAGFAPPGPTSTQKIAIPTVCAGCVIGKGGAVIRDIRVQSSTTISIADPDEITPQERVVTIAGSPQGIQAAIYLIRQLVEQYQPPPQAAVQQHMLPPQHQQLPPMNQGMGGIAQAMGNLQMDPYAHPQY